MYISPGLQQIKAERRLHPGGGGDLVYLCIIHKTSAAIILREVCLYSKPEIVYALNASTMVDHILLYHIISDYIISKCNGAKTLVNQFNIKYNVWQALYSFSFFVRRVDTVVRSQ